MVDETQATFSIDQPKTFKLNRRQSAFYRAIYDAKHLQRLGQLIQAKKLGPLDRLGILSDAFEAAKAGYGSTVDALQLLSYYQDEDNAAVWDVIAGNVLSIRAVLADEALRETMKPFLRQLVQKQYQRLGWAEKPADSHFDKLLRLTVLSVASLGEEPDVIQRATDQFNSAKSPSNILPDFRSLVYNTRARLGGPKDFDKLTTWHHKATLSEERTTLCSAITGFKQPTLIKKALSLIDTDEVRHQDVTYWVAYSFMNRHAKSLTWEWMTTHWEWLQKNLGSDLSFYRFPIFAARSFYDEAFLKQYQAFFEPRLTPAFERSYKQGIEIIQWQADWRKRDAQAVKQFFTAQSKGS